MNGAVTALLILATLAASAAPFSEEDPPGSGRFLVVTTQRSGSTWLQDLLREIGRVSNWMLSTMAKPQTQNQKTQPQPQRGKWENEENEKRKRGGEPQRLFPHP